MVKSKLCPRSGPGTLRQVNPIHKKGHQKDLTFFKAVLYLICILLLIVTARAHCSSSEMICTYSSKDKKYQTVNLPSYDDYKIITI